MDDTDILLLQFVVITLLFVFFISLVGKATYCSIMWNKRFNATGKRFFFVNNPTNLTSKNISTEHCFVDYKNVNNLENQSGFCTAAAAQYCAAQPTEELFYPMFIMY